MKICKNCKTIVKDKVDYCPTCKGFYFENVKTKICKYCDSPVALGTVICPNCHRVLPPEKAGDVVYEEKNFEREENPFLGRDFQPRNVSRERLSDEPMPITIPTYGSGLQRDENFSREEISPKRMKREPLKKDENFSHEEISQKRVKSEPVKEDESFDEEEGKLLFRMEKTSDFDDFSFPLKEEVENAALSQSAENKMSSKSSVKESMSFLQILAVAAAFFGVAGGMLLPYFVIFSDQIVGFQLMFTVIPFLKDIFTSSYATIIFASMEGLNLTLAKWLPFVLNVGVVLLFVNGVLLLFTNRLKTLQTVLGILSFVIFAGALVVTYIPFGALGVVKYAPIVFMAGSAIHLLLIILSGKNKSKG